jgi:hypothetical protein
MSSGSTAHSSTDKLAVMWTRPSRLNAYATPGFSTPSNPSPLTRDDHEREERFGRVTISSAMTLAPS